MDEEGPFRFSLLSPALCCYSRQPALRRTALYACASAGIAAIGLINEALDEGDPAKTLSMLQSPSAKLTDVDPSVAQHYHDKLLEARREKAHVSAHGHRRTRAHAAL